MNTDDQYQTEAAQANQEANGEDMVNRTERGLVIRGTRTTLYAIMDYVHADWPRQQIRDWMRLSDEQIDGAMAYIHSHREQVESDYQEVVRRAEESRRYWEEFARNRPMPPRLPESPERAALRAKFEEWKSKLPKE